MVETVQPSAGVWHEPQLRPLVPNCLKKSLRRSTSPAVLDVEERPSSFTNGKLFGSRVPISDSLVLVRGLGLTSDGSVSAVHADAETNSPTNRVEVARHGIS